VPVASPGQMGPWRGRQTVPPVVSAEPSAATFHRNAALAHSDQWPAPAPLGWLSGSAKWRDGRSTSRVMRADLPDEARTTYPADTVPAASASVREAPAKYASASLRLWRGTAPSELALPPRSVLMVCATYRASVRPPVTLASDRVRIAAVATQAGSRDQRIATLAATWLAVDTLYQMNQGGDTVGACRPGQRQWYWIF